MANNDRAELERRLEQVRRLFSQVSDYVSQERMRRLIGDLEEQLGKPKKAASSATARQESRLN